MIDQRGTHISDDPANVDRIES